MRERYEHDEMQLPTGLSAAYPSTRHGLAPFAIFCFTLDERRNVFLLPSLLGFPGICSSLCIYSLRENFISIPFALDRRVGLFLVSFSHIAGIAVQN
jgi:hypothetical protein